MPRKRVVTRTITTTKVTVFGFDKVAQELCNKEITLTGTFATEKKLLKAIESAINPNEYKVIEIAFTTTENKLYKMSEEKFVENADEVVEATAEAEAEE